MENLINSQISGRVRIIVIMAMDMDIMVMVMADIMIILGQMNTMYFLVSYLIGKEELYKILKQNLKCSVMVPGAISTLLG